MSLTIKVPTIVCEGCSDIIIKAIQSQQSDAKVFIDLATKVVTIETSATETEIKSIIVSTGHSPE